MWSRTCRAAGKGEMSERKKRDEEGERGRGCGRGCRPVFERLQERADLVGLDIAAHGVLDLELLLLLVELAAEEVEVDGVDDEVFELAYRRYLEGLEEVRVGQDLGTTIRSDGVRRWVNGRRVDGRGVPLRRR